MTNLQQYFRTLTILHIAMLAGSLMFSGVIISLSLSGAGKSDPALNNVLLPVAAVLSIAGCAASHFLFSARVKAIRDITGLGQKLTAYRGLLIVRWGLLEAPTLFAIVCYFLTGNKLLLALAALPLLLLAVSRPSRERTVTDLELTWEDKAILDDPQAEIEGMNS